jgi:hypothetical protein
VLRAGAGTIIVAAMVDESENGEPQAETRSYASREDARRALPGDVGAAYNRFFRDASPTSRELTIVARGGEYHL